VEMAHLQTWLDAVERALTSDYALAVELLRCRRLIKGYSDTHARGAGRFERLLHAATVLAGRDGAGASLARLREAALQDAEGNALDQALRAMQLAA
jgi:indolepyruvate ferredoxin oxidoreductase, beta subunit